MKLINNNRHTTRHLTHYRRVTLATLLCTAPAINAFDFGNMMNPSRWFGGNDDYYYSEYGAFAPGYTPYGLPAYPPHYTAPGQAPLYYAPNLTVVAPPVATPAAPNMTPSAPIESKTDAKDQEIAALKRRIEQLEAGPPAPSPITTTAPPFQLPPPVESNPAHRFRPLDQ